MEKTKVVTLLSGGLDSTVLLYHILAEGYQPYVLSVFYGQRHKIEISYARMICKNLGISQKILDITNINELILKGCLAGKEEVPFGHYEAENMKSTIVSNRNMILLSIATGYAATINAEKVFYGAHAGDHQIYPDCRKEFVKALDSAIYLGNLWENNNKSIELIAPFTEMTKADLVKLGIKLKVPFENTWSCYSGTTRPCLRCSTDIERTEAFIKNNIQDPALSNEEWLQAVKYYKEIVK
jgi:7-cyano-7-deazaguanine synthase